AGARASAARRVARRRTRARRGAVGAPRPVVVEVEQLGEGSGVVIGAAGVGDLLEPHGRLVQEGVHDALGERLHGLALPLVEVPQAAGEPRDRGAAALLCAESKRRTRGFLYF